MTGMTTIRLWSAILVAVDSVACSSITDQSKNTTEPFSGQVQPNGYGMVHSFNISNSGELTVVVNTIVPGSTFLAVAYGQTSGASCAVLQQNAVSSANLGKTIITAQLTNKGNYCVQAFDPSLLGLGLPALVVGQNYTLTVSHP
jgi:hypothetical protein